MHEPQEANYLPTPEEIAERCAEIREKHLAAKRKGGGDNPKEKVYGNPHAVIVDRHWGAGWMV